MCQINLLQAGQINPRVMIERFASVNSNSARPPPPGLTPGHKHFFKINGQILRGGDTKAV